MAWVTLNQPHRKGHSDGYIHIRSSGSLGQGVIELWRSQYIGLYELCFSQEANETISLTCVTTGKVSVEIKLHVTSIHLASQLARL